MPHLHVADVMRAPSFCRLILNITSYTTTKEWRLIDTLDIVYRLGHEHEHRHFRRMAAKFRPMLASYGISAERGLYRATPSWASIYTRPRPIEGPLTTSQ